MADKEKLSIRNTEEHKRLASVLKSVHADLRKKLRQYNGDFDAVWSQHCQDQNLLTTYAQSMKLLAEDHWTKNSKTRIDWCRDTINEYYHGGGLKKVLEKEMKRQLREMRTDEQKHGKSDSRAEENVLEKSECQDALLSGRTVSGGCVGDQQSADIKKQVSETRDQAENDGGSTAGTCISTNRWVPAEGQRLRLLDVGSCYNPFLHCQEFLAVGLDLSPACQSVHQCDFLRLHVTGRPEEERRSGAGGGWGAGENPGKDEVPEAMMDKVLESLSSPVEALPALTFHAAVFSLLLEYLPDPRPRFLCCLQAHRLLRPHGLLLIVTPDSHSQHRNAPMMRSWRTAIETLGFSRWRYVKQEHMHCMAFRKLDQHPSPYPPIPSPPHPSTSRPHSLEDSTEQASGWQDPVQHGLEEKSHCPETKSLGEPASFGSKASSGEGSAGTKSSTDGQGELAFGSKASAGISSSGDGQSSSLQDSVQHRSEKECHHHPKPEGLEGRACGSKASSEASSGAATSSGDFSRAFLDSAFVSRFSAMMYIPQDFSGLGGEEEEGEEKEQDFAGEEDRQEFFSAADSELPGFVSEDED